MAPQVEDYSQCPPTGGARFEYFRAELENVSPQEAGGVAFDYM